MENFKIIIADDNVNLAKIMKDYIEKNSDFEILDIVTNSKQQLELMEKYNIDIILTDNMRKEEISGLDIIIKSYKENRKEKFILVTASPKEEILFKNNFKIPNNIIGYLKKPFDLDLLILELKKAQTIITNTKI